MCFSIYRLNTWFVGSESVCANRSQVFADGLCLPPAAGHSTDPAMVNGGGPHEHTEELQPKQDEVDGGEDSNEQEVIMIQDTGFTVKIQAPGTEPFDLQVRRKTETVGGCRHHVTSDLPPSCQVSPQEMVQEIHQVLIDREDTCHRTCFSLQLDGNVLDNFADLKSIEGLQEGSLLKVVEGQSSSSSAMSHNSKLKQSNSLTPCVEDDDCSTSDSLVACTHFLV